MCERFTQAYAWSGVHDFLSVFGMPRSLRSCYNIGPSTSMDVVRLGEAGRELVPMRWGLCPSFEKTRKEVPATFNAYTEPVAEKPMFREGFKRRSYIISASGFFEWTGEKGDKQPHLFTVADGSPTPGGVRVMFAYGTDPPRQSTLPGPFEMCYLCSIMMGRGRPP